jgi:hypothetical protein
VVALLKTVDELDEMLQDIEYQAEGLGMADFDDGFHNPPEMFSGDVILMQAWRAGHHSQAELEEMRACQGCQSPTYDWNGVCAVHG